jgi:putative tricarboxylic transport membrane protein
VKLNDALWGALLLLLAGALLWHVQGFPSIPGQQVGPGALPRALAIGLGVCGAILLMRGWRERATSPWLERPAWITAHPQVTALAVLAGVNLFYLLAVQRLGFVVTGIVYLAALMWAFRVRPPRALAIAIVATLAIHYCFYKLLKVPLPWGLLQPIAW